MPVFVELDNGFCGVFRGELGAVGFDRPGWLLPQQDFSSSLPSPAESVPAFPEELPPQSLQPITTVAPDAPAVLASGIPWNAQLFINQPLFLKATKLPRIPEQTSGRVGGLAGGW